MKNFSFRVTLVLALVLSLTAWNLLRLWTSLAWSATLIEFAGAPILAETLISAAVWSLVGIIIAWSILEKKILAPKIFVGATISYSIWYWVERLAWQTPRPNWLFAVIVNLAFVIFTLRIKKSLSREAYERKIENPTTE